MLDTQDVSFSAWISTSYGKTALLAQILRNLQPDDEHLLWTDQLAPSRCEEDGARQTAL